MLHLFGLAVLGVPLSWRKVNGGVQVEWVGYFMDLGRFELGVTEKRAQWVVRWLGDKIAERQVRLGDLREGLGRLQFVAGALEVVRPFLGPLYRWASAGPRYARPFLPVMIRLLMGFIAKEIGQSRMSKCVDRDRDLGEVFRLDAKAEGEEVAIGGWRSEGGRPTREAAWFAVKLNRRNAPWAFARGETFRVIASLELLGMLVGTMVLMPVSEFSVATPSVGLVTIGCGTDNRGNSFLLDRLLTTAYPLGILLCELAVQLRTRGAVMRAEWVPRLQNEEADALTNSDFRHFSEELRVPVKLEELRFEILDQLLETGEAYLSEVEAARSQEKLRLAGTAGSAGHGRKRTGASLREREPW